MPLPIFLPVILGTVRFPSINLNFDLKNLLELDVIVSFNYMLDGDYTHVFRVEGECKERRLFGMLSCDNDPHYYQTMCVSCIVHCAAAWWS